MHDESAPSLDTIPGQYIEDGLYNPMIAAHDGISDQRLLKEQRIHDWPDPSSEAQQLRWAHTYRIVKQTGTPNETCARVPIKSNLNLALWYDSATGHHDDKIVLDGITYGFSLQYLGGPLAETDVEMHSSGEKYMPHIQEYLDTEIKHGAIAGPFASPPFIQWNRTMQKIANMISRALLARGIVTQIYLDDVILHFSPNDDPPARMKEAISYMKALGLPLAEEKVQFPSHKVRYLGIWLDVKDRLLTIPSEKITKFLQLVEWLIEQESVSKRIVQSLIGKIIHFSACVPASRTFINRILAALRAAHNDSEVSVTTGMLADLKWFRRFLKKYNGKSIMKSAEPSFIIEADACLVGAGATDFKEYLAYTFPERVCEFHISVLEALNCLAACRALLTSEKHSTTVLIRCDNIATIESFTRGSARDKYLAAISRAMWYCLARADVNPIYQYVPGHLMYIPDALSRMHLSPSYDALARRIIERLRITQKVFHNHYLDFHDFL